jgi:hypothetical protein
LAGNFGVFYDYHSRRNAPMPHLPLVRIALFSTFLMMAGCGKSPEERLAGKWVGDRIDNVSADQVARATGWVKGTTFEFAGDKLTVTVPAEPARKGTFKVSRLEGDKMVLLVARSDTQAHDEATLTLHNDKTMTWDIGRGREVLLVRTGL